MAEKRESRPPEPLDRTEQSLEARRLAVEVGAAGARPQRMAGWVAAFVVGATLLGLCAGAAAALLRHG